MELATRGPTRSRFTQLRAGTHRAPQTHASFAFVFARPLLLCVVPTPSEVRACLGLSFFRFHPESNCFVGIVKPKK